MTRRVQELQGIQGYGSLKAARSRNRHREGPRALPCRVKVVSTKTFSFRLWSFLARADVALRRIVERQDQLVMSRHILDEMSCCAFSAASFSRDARRARAYRGISLRAGSYRPSAPPAGCAWVNDEPDNRILECALAARTEAIVTGDRAVLNLDEYRGVRTITLPTTWATRNAFSARSGQRTQFLHCRVASRNFVTDCLTKDVTDLIDEAKGPRRRHLLTCFGKRWADPSMCCLSGGFGIRRACGPTGNTLGEATSPTSNNRLEAMRRPR
jgi:predicted nucleic acid-binding protein